MPTFFEPLRVGEIELDNRIVMAPMTRSRADERGVQPAFVAEYYRQRASAGLMTAPSPVVELNRAVAIAMAFGPAAGLEMVGALAEEPALKGYHLLPSVRGDLLFKLGRLEEARAEFERAAALTRNERERELLLARAEACAAGES